MSSQVTATPDNTDKITENKTKFWVVCCEETAVTRQIVKTVAEWNLPGVRSLLTTDLSEAEAIAQSEYAIFITTCAQPNTQIKMSPLTLAQSAAVEKTTEQKTEPTPASQLIAMHEQYGQSPQAWWFQLPTTEVRAQKVQPVATEKSVAQCLAQVEIFVRNYTRELSITARTASADKNATHAAPTEKSQPAKAQLEKRKVTLSHYRRL